LKELGLGIYHEEYNNIEDQGCFYFSKCLLHNTHLEMLDLSSNNISANGAKYLSEALPLNQSLLSLEIGWISSK